MPKRALTCLPGRGPRTPGHCMPYSGYHSTHGIHATNFGSSFNGVTGLGARRGCAERFTGQGNHGHQKAAKLMQSSPRSSVTLYSHLERNASPSGHRACPCRWGADAAEHLFPVRAPAGDNNEYLTWRMQLYILACHTAGKSSRGGCKLGAARALHRSPLC